MPSATYIGFDTGIGGSWPGGRGAGWYMMDSTKAVVSSLPAPISSVVQTAGTKENDLANTPAINLRLPGGGAYVVTSFKNASLAIDLADSRPVLVAQYVRALGAPSNFDVVRLQLQSSDGLTTYVDVSPVGATLNDGTWIYYQIQGPGTIVSVNIGYQRVQGLLFDLPPTASGRLLCLGPGRSGLIA